MTLGPDLINQIETQIDTGPELVLQSDINPSPIEVVVWVDAVFGSAARLPDDNWFLISPELIYQCQT
jgi:hypothetical protein